MNVNRIVRLAVVAMYSTALSSGAVAQVGASGRTAAGLGAAAAQDPDAAARAAAQAANQTRQANAAAEAQRRAAAAAAQAESQAQAQRAANAAAAAAAAVVKPGMPGLAARGRAGVKFGAQNARAGSTMSEAGVFTAAPKQNIGAGGVVATGQGLSVKSDTIWDSPIIPVCWEDASGYYTERTWVRDAIRVTWEAESKLRFTGWNSCSGGSRSIHLQIADEHPRAKGLGKKLDGMTDGIVFNFTFNNWEPSCKSTLEYCVKSIAVHEFGHAIGAGHEQNRNDEPDPACADRAQGDDPDWNITPYDIDSVMNYCNAHWNGDGRLSVKDIEGVRSIYGWRRSSTFEATGVGNKGQGAGAVLVDLNGNGWPEMILAADDAPSGANHLRYRVSQDLTTDGESMNWGPLIQGPSMGDESQDAGLAVGDINGNGRPDLIWMTYDNPSGANHFRYSVGYDLNASGMPTAWGQINETTGFGDEGQGAGAALVDINRDGKLDLVLMAYDAPSGANSFRYKIGYSIGAGGVPQSWSSMYTVAGMGDEGQGAGLAVADFDHDGQFEMILMAYDTGMGDEANNFRYRHIKLGPQGQPAGEIRNRVLPGVGEEGDGADLAIGDLDRDGWLDLIFVAYDAPQGGNNFRYTTYKDVTEP